MDAAVETYGRLDVVVCNAAILAGAHVDPLVLPAETFSRVLAVNLTGMFLTARSGARRMGEDGGAIVTVGSRASRRGNPALVAYSAAKFGVIGLTQSLAMSLASRQIRVNCVCPGAVDTDMGDAEAERQAASRGMTAEALRAERANAMPMGRLTTPEDVANAIVWLAGEETAQLTGQAIDVNGGTWMG